MGRTLVALYHDSQTAQRVVEALLEAGFSSDDISVLANDAEQVSDDSLNEEVTTSECASLGAVVGALVGIGSVLIPGIGPVLGIGPLSILVTAGIGAAAGAITGGITAGLIDVEPDSEPDVQSYGNGLALNGTIISLTTNEQWLEWGERIMLRYEPLKIEGREANWYGSAWMGFSPAASESRRMQTLPAGSSTTMRQINSVPSLQRRTRIYNSPN